MYIRKSRLRKFVFRCNAKTWVRDGYLDYESIRHVAYEKISRGLLFFLTYTSRLPSRESTETFYSQYEGTNHYDSLELCSYLFSRFAFFWDLFRFDEQIYQISPIVRKSLTFRLLTEELKIWLYRLNY